MEVPFEPEFACPPAADGCICTPKLPAGLTIITAASLRHPHARTRDACSLVVEKLGAASAIAQRLPVPITSPLKLSTSPTHRVYIAYTGRLLLGLLKVGVKDLFISEGGVTVEVSPLCVLDFFVTPSHRRQGVGRTLFNAMLANEGVAPERMGYDRPSMLFLSFLATHFNLKSFTPQANNFVVFHNYFKAPVAHAALPATAGRIIPPAAATAGGVPTRSIDLDAPRPATVSTPSRPHVGVGWTPASAAAPFATDHNSPVAPPPPSAVEPHADVIIPGYTAGVRRGLKF